MRRRTPAIGDVVDARGARIVDALEVKRQVLESATKAATMLLRIDDVVAATELAGGDITNEPDDVEQE